MLIGRVIGDVVATQKVPSHEGRKILVVQPLQLDGADRGDPVLALDAVDAGVGDRVLLTTEGFSAMTAVGRPNSPIDAAVIGVIDSVGPIGNIGVIRGEWRLMDQPRQRGGPEAARLRATRAGSLRARQDSRNRWV